MRKHGIDLILLLIIFASLLALAWESNADLPPDSPIPRPTATGLPPTKTPTPWARETLVKPIPTPPIYLPIIATK